MMPIVRLCFITGIDLYCTVHLVTQESRTATEFDMLGFNKDQKDINSAKADVWWANKIRDFVILYILYLF